MELRPYQQQSVQAVLTEWDNGHKKTLVVQATGTGKTIVFAKITEARVRVGDRVLVLAHRGELLDQAADKIYKATGLKCAVEKAEQSCKGSWYRIVVGSVQTLMRDKRLQRFPPDYFGTIIIDEAHHCVSDSYQHVLQHFPNANVLGVTATADRSDKRNLGTYFDSLAFEYNLPNAIKDGYLCKIVAQTIPLQLDITAVGMSAGDFKAGELGTALDPYLAQIAEEMVQYCADRKTVVFLPLVKTSQKFCRLLQEKGFRAAEVNGESDARKQILADFDSGKYNILCNSMLLTEGWDCPSVDCIIVLRATKSRGLYSQMIGRGTRLSPGKENLLLLDFLWLTEKHDLCRPACLLAKSGEMADAMTKRIEEAAEPMDIEEAEQQAADDVIADREEKLAEQLNAMRKRKRQLVDPLQYAVSIRDEDLASYVPSFGFEIGPATPQQISMLEKFGIFAENIDSAGKASILLDKLIQRKEAGLATPKQIRLLEQRGFTNVGTWMFTDASKLIGQIAANSWRVPRSIHPQDYKPGA